MTTKHNQKGKVKWFSEDRGFGYITNNENKDLYFGVKDIEGAELPEHGDLVLFSEYIGKENTAAATEIKILERKKPRLNIITCPDCKRKVEPKPWYYGGSDYTVVSVDLICPFCSYRIAKNGGGFNIFAKTILVVFVLALVFVFTKIV